MARTLGTLIVLLFISTALAQNRPKTSTLPPSVVESAMTRSCLDCLCYAGTECDENIRCHNAGPGSYYCGPYQISWAYWADGGKPGNDPKNPISFEQCLNTKACSEKAILGYMKKFARDCDNDGKFTCDDVVLIHKAGPYGCNASWILDTPYWNNYLQCQRAIRATDSAIHY